MTAERDAYLDNAKFILMIFVVFGHLLQAIPGVAADLFRTVYIFHMPAFIFLAGAVSGSTLKRSALLTLASAYIIFNVVYVLLDKTISPYFMPGCDFFSYTNVLWPIWVTWFILSLIFWRAGLVLFKRSKFPVLIALAAAMLVGFVDGNGSILSFSRTFVFLPYFIGGYYHKDILEKTRHAPSWTKPVALIVLAGILTGVYFLPRESQIYLWGAAGYAESPGGFWWSPLFRALQLMTAAVASFAFFILVPQKKSIMSIWGSRTISPFLLHALFVIALCPLLKTLEPVPLFIVALASAILATCLLSTKPVYKTVITAIDQGARLLDKIIPEYKKS